MFLVIAVEWRVLEGAEREGGMDAIDAAKCFTQPV
jgi:hypothetical protein